MTDAPTHSPSHRDIVMLALPLIASNLTVPLIGLVDTAVAGHLPGAGALAAVGAASAVSSVVLIGLNFLRMSTSGLSAQAHGAQDPGQTWLVFFRSALLALALAGVLVLARHDIAALGISLIAPPGDVAALAKEYLHIRLFAAPLTLLSMVSMGFFIGVGRPKVALVMTIATNLVNVGLDLLLVPGLGWGVSGLAWATIGGELAGLLAALPFLLKRWRADAVVLDTQRLWNPQAWRKLLSGNADLWIRSLCLTGSFAVFARQAAQLGETALAANVALLQFQALMSYGLDGFANAAEVLVGQALGARDGARAKRAIRLAIQWSLGLALVFAVAFALGGNVLVAFMTDLPEIRVAAASLMLWMVLSPLVSVWAFTFDGIFIGGTWTRPMRNSVVAGAVTFGLALFLLQEPYGHQGLWAAFLMFFAVRGMWLAVALRGRVDAAVG
jgi:multidrug resistance protein, MATE family